MNGRVIKEVGIKQARLIVTIVIIDFVGQGLKYELGDNLGHPRQQRRLEKIK